MLFALAQSALVQRYGFNRFSPQGHMGALVAPEGYSLRPISRVPMSPEPRPFAAQSTSCAESENW